MDEKDADVLKERLRMLKFRNELLIDAGRKNYQDAHDAQIKVNFLEILAERQKNLIDQLKEELTLFRSKFTQFEIIMGVKGTAADPEKECSDLPGNRDLKALEKRLDAFQALLENQSKRIVELDEGVKVRDAQARLLKITLKNALKRVLRPSSLNSSSITERFGGPLTGFGFFSQMKQELADVEKEENAVNDKTPTGSSFLSQIKQELVEEVENAENNKTPTGSSFLSQLKQELVEEEENAENNKTPTGSSSLSQLKQELVDEEENAENNKTPTGSSSLSQMKQELVEEAENAENYKSANEKSKTPGFDPLNFQEPAGGASGWESLGLGSSSMSLSGSQTEYKDGMNVSLVDTDSLMEVEDLTLGSICGNNETPFSVPPKQAPVEISTCSSSQDRNPIVEIEISSEDEEVEVVEVASVDIVISSEDEEVEVVEVASVDVEISSEDEEVVEVASVEVCQPMDSYDGECLTECFSCGNIFSVGKTTFGNRNNISNSDMKNCCRKCGLKIFGR